MFRLKFKEKVLLYILIPSILIIGIVQFTSYTISGDIVMNEAEKNMTEKTNGAKRLIEQQIKSNKTYLQLITSTASTREAIANESKAGIESTISMFKKIITQNKYLETMLLVDKDGEIIASDSEKNIGISIADRKYFQQSMKGDTYTSNCIKSKATGHLLFIVSVPVIIDNKVAGVIASCNKIEALAENIINPIRIGETGYALVTDNEGVFIVHPNKSLLMNRDVLNKPNMLNIVKLGEGTHHYYWAVDDLDKVLRVTKTNNGWFVAVTVPENELLSVITPIKYLSIGGAVALMLVLCGIVFLVIGRVAKILTALKDNINNLAQGVTHEIEAHHKTLQKALKRNDEFTEITQAADNIQTYLKDMSDVALKIAAKDLTVRPKIRCRDDVLGNAMETLINEFSTAFNHVSNTVQQVNKGAQQLSSASMSLSQGATEQAASIEEITASVAELGTQTDTNAENAASASNLAHAANKSAITGEQEMEKLSTAMNIITSRAEETQKVIKSIDDIAFQTNLLALNAAVEAARAGAHGKGFAVVAEEVRNLAARSAKAAAETAELIENVVQEITSGNELTDITAKTFHEIVTGISESSSLIGEIAAASNEQAEGVSQINQGLQQIEKVTQSNTANAEETASSSEEMSSMSLMLNQLVSEFSLPGERELKRNTQGVTNDRHAAGNRKKIPAGMRADIITPEKQIRLDDSEFGKF